MDAPWKKAVSRLNSDALVTQLPSNSLAQNNSFKEKMEAKIPAPQILDEILQKYRDEMIDSESSLSIAIYEYFSRKKIEGNDNLLIKQYKASVKNSRLKSRASNREQNLYG